MTATTAPTVLTARALLLDMDGTLVNSDAVVERCWRRWADRHGLDAAEVMKVVHGRQGHASMALLLPDRPMEQNLADNARMLAEETADMDGVVAIPGAPAFLASLRGPPARPGDLGRRGAVHGPDGRRRPGAARRARHRRVGRREQAGPRGLPEGRRRTGRRPRGLRRLRGLRRRESPAGRAAGMRVVGVGARGRLPRAGRGGAGSDARSGWRLAADGTLRHSTRAGGHLPAGGAGGGFMRPLAVRRALPDAGARSPGGPLPTPGGPGSRATPPASTSYGS